MSAIVYFYRGESRDRLGRSLDDIRGFSHRQLEDVHNYIQWLFPLRTRGVAPAPLLDDETVAAFRGDASLREELLRSFDVMLDFYGLKRLGDAVLRAETFDERAENWLTPCNHNFLRITRILQCLGELGLEKWARAYFRCLEDIHAEYDEIIGDSIHYWSEAVTH